MRCFLIFDYFTRSITLLFDKISYFEHWLKGLKVRILINDHVFFWTSQGERTR